MRFPTCARIHLDRLRFNYHQIQKKIAPARLIPVVKADAYGHGAIAVSKCLVSEGAQLLAVAQFQEAMELRDSGIDVPILIFGRLFPEELKDAIREGFRITLFGVDDAIAHPGDVVALMLHGPGGTEAGEDQGAEHGEQRDEAAAAAVDFAVIDARHV